MLRLGLSPIVAAALAASLGGCIISDDGDSDLTLYNESSYALVEIHLAEINQDTWGPNLIRGDVLLPGESITIIDIECGTYDVLVVDETNVDCELRNLDLCFDSDAWVIDDFTLDVCYANPLRQVDMSAK